MIWCQVTPFCCHHWRCQGRLNVAFNSTPTSSLYSTRLFDDHFSLISATHIGDAIDVQAIRHISDFYTGSISDLSHNDQLTLAVIELKTCRPKWLAGLKEDLVRSRIGIRDETGAFNFLIDRCLIILDLVFAGKILRQISRVAVLVIEGTKDLSEPGALPTQPGRG